MQIMPSDVEIIRQCAKDAAAFDEIMALLQRLPTPPLDTDVFDHLPVPIALTTPHGNDHVVVFVNRAFEDLTGYAFHEMLGKDLRLLQGEQTASSAHATIRRAIQENKPCQVVIRNYRKNGSAFLNDLHIVPITNADSQKPTHHLSVLCDVTQITEDQERRIELSAEHARQQAVRAFAENAGHQFRTPLTIITTSLYSLLHTDDETTRTDRMERILAQIRHITRLLDMAILMSTLPTNIPWPKTPLDMQQIVQDAVDRVAKDDRNQHQILVQRGAGLLPVLGHAEHLTEAIEQVLDNACRFTPADGEIIVRLSRLPDAVYLRISDTGIGIAQEHLQHVFKSFWRLDAAGATRGFGLGLAIARRIIYRHDGTIWLTSTVGEGTTVHIEIPLAI